MLAWFWLTPIAYVYSLLASRLGSESRGSCSSTP